MTFRCYFIFAGSNNLQNMQNVTVKKEPEDIPSTSQHEQQQIQIQQQQQQQPQTQTIAVSVAPNQTTTHTLVEAANNPNGGQAQHIVTQHENSDGSTSLQIAQMQNIPATHQLTLSNLNQVKAIDLIYSPFTVDEIIKFCCGFICSFQSNKNHIVLKKVIFVKGNNANT